MSGIYEYNGQLLYGDGRKVETLVDMDEVAQPPTKNLGGRPRKERDAAKIWSEEQGELANLARDVRKMLTQQIEMLRKEAEGITNVRQRQEIIQRLVNTLGELTKNIKVQMTETQKEPRDQDEVVDLDKIYKGLMK